MQHPAALWRCPIVKRLLKHDVEGRLNWPKKQGGVPRLKKYESEREGVPLQDIWTDISKIHNQSAELTGYSTQKPEALIERIIKLLPMKATWWPTFCVCKRGRWF